MERGVRAFIVLLSLATVAGCADARAIEQAEGGPEPSGPTITTSPSTVPTIPPLPTRPGDAERPTSTVPLDGADAPETPPLPTLPPPPPPPDPVTVLAAGNLGACNAHSIEVAEAMANALGDDDILVAAGDLSADGTSQSLATCFTTVFADDLDRVLAVPGDRDLAADAGAAFFDLLSSTATSTIPGQGWFVSEVGGWQVIGLNSRCADAGGCDVGSLQYRWLDELLREQPAQCRAVIWHDARFSSADGIDAANDMGPILGRLDGAGIDLLITGSPGNYERLGPLRPSGAPAEGDEPGLRHFNIGGGSNVGFDAEPVPGSIVRKDAANGYVRFVLGPEGYTWEFVATSDANSPPDTGSADCGPTEE